MGSFITRLDLFSVSIFPENYKDKQSYGSCLGLIITISFFFLFYAIYLSYQSTVKYDNYKWNKLPQMNLLDFNYELNDEKNTTIHDQHYNGTIFFDGEDNQIYVKFKAYTQMPITPAKTQAYYDAILNKDKCVNPDGYCKLSNYDFTETLNGSEDDVKFQFDVKKYNSGQSDFDKTAIGMKALLDGSTTQLKFERTFSQKATFQKKICANQICKENYFRQVSGKKVYYDEMLNNTYPVFDKVNRFELDIGEVLIVTVMAKKNYIMDKGLGYVMSLMYHEREYDADQNQDVTDANNFKKIPKYPENQEDVWVKMGKFFDVETNYAYADGYIKGPFLSELTRTYEFGVKSTFVNNNYLPFSYWNLFGLESFYENLKEVRSIHNMRQVDNDKIHIFKGEEATWSKTAGSHFNPNYIMIGQFFVINNGEKDNSTVERVLATNFLAYVLTWVLLLLCCCNCCVGGCNRYFFGQYYYRALDEQVRPHED